MNRQLRTAALDLLRAAALAAPLLAAACATPPSAAEMAGVPVVRFGENAPASGKYVLLYPAHVALPVDAAVTGSLFDAPDHATLKVALKRDVYTYGPWSSLDGKTWEPGNKLVGSQVRIEMPGVKDGHNAGTLAINFDLK
jgi:hypothetical protein